VKKEDRLPQLNAVFIPEGADDAAVRSTLLNDYNLEIGAGLGAYAGKVWRIGLMGHTSRLENITLCLAALKDNPDAVILAFVHAETSTGALSDAKTLCQLAHQYDCINIVDAVTSLGGVELRVDEWEIDAIYSGTQKCLSAMPGISPISISERAIKKLTDRKIPVTSWFLDLNLVMGYWGEGAKRTYHHTAPVNTLYGLHESLVMLSDEGLENAWARHQSNHEILRDGLEAMGINFLVKKEDRLPQLNAVFIPEGADDAAVRSTLLNDYNLEIGAGLGAYAGKVWRIGLMGHTSRLENITLCLAALKATLNK
jgi:alanine-glyoxylate transaminase/serine-glyoxylate transaminase/serine-pyruvate transaminase